MKKIIFTAIGIVLIFVVLPFMLTFIIKGFNFHNPPQNLNTVWLFSENNWREIDREEYIYGVICSKYSPALPDEVLKALAVCERSALMLNLSGHDSRGVCDNPEHCTSYITPENAKDKWDIASAELNLRKILSAVNVTKDTYLSFRGLPASPLYHEISACGATENAIDFLGENIPYLISVNSNDEASSAASENYFKFSKQNFEKQIASVFPDINFKLMPYIGFSETTNTGNVLSVTVCNKRLSGRDFAKLFQLPSTAFSVALNEDEIIIKTKGVGTSLGLSIKGAENMAENKKNYREILLHFYPGCEILSK